jgi:hypothetical protein
LRNPRIILAAALLGVALATPADAAEPFYIGNWKIVSAVVAPWADPAREPLQTERNALLGKTVAVKPKDITGPRALVCKGAKYQVSDVPADTLFQGAFGEMHEKNPSVDPAKLAASLGFTGSSWKTLETGCEIDFHFIDPATAAIGLNDYVYTLKKQ